MGESKSAMTETQSYFSAAEIYWEITLGGTSYEHFNFAQIIENENIIVTGMTDSIGQGSSDMWVVKMDSDGYVLWEKRRHNGYRQYC